MAMKAARGGTVGCLSPRVGGGATTQGGERCGERRGHRHLTGARWQMVLSLAQGLGMQRYIMLCGGFVER